jgi:lantibiotic transport system permease protein
MWIRYFMRTISAEVLKLKRTLALRMAFIAPVVVVGLVFLVFHQRKGLGQTGVELWKLFSLQIISLWSLLMLPMFITLEAALLGGIENGEKNWKHLFALPVPRGTIYATKLFAVVALIGLSTAVLFAGAVAAGCLLGALKPQYQVGFSNLPWNEMVRPFLFSYLCAWLMIAIQIWVSVRWQTFTVALGTGISATVIGYVLINSEKWGKIYPYTLPANVLMPNGNITRAVVISLIGFVIAAILGGYEFTRRDVA